MSSESRLRPCCPPGLFGAPRRRDRRRSPRDVLAVFAGLVLLATALVLFAAPAGAQRNPDALLSAVVGVNADIPPGARTAQRLGTHREGSGAVVSDDGLVLTIGYLILEASRVEIERQDGATVPAEIVAYDHDSGFGLVRALQPLGLPALDFGDSAPLDVSQPALVVTRLGRGEARGVYIVSRREFAGSWEYLLDSAIYTAPPHANFAGAALLGVDGRLLGIGSLFVGDAAVMGRPLPGNMFVPIDELKPIYDSLVANGRRPGPARPWLGLYPSAVHGRVFVDALAEDGPAAHAGLARGDLIVAVGGKPVGAVTEFFRSVWANAKAGDTITLSVLSRGGGVREVPIVSIDRTQWLRLDPSL